MKRIIVRCWQLVLFLGLATSGAAAGTLTGVVRNATTGTPAAGVDVILLQLRGGMEAVASTKTDAQGRFHLENPDIGQQPMLVRAVYHGINFHQSVPPGRETADVEVFEPTADASAIAVTSRLVVLQPNGATLLVGEEYSVQNDSKPPAAYFKPDGNFEFQIPADAELAQVSAWGPSGMPVVQGTIDRGNRRYAIAFAFRPGESGVRLSYKVPYASNRTTLRLASPYAARRVALIAPPSMQVTSSGFQPAGTEQGFNVYTRDAVAAKSALEVMVSGTAPPPSASVDSGQTDAANSRGSSAPVQALPSRLDSLKWVLVGGFAALFFLGLLFLWRKPAPATNPPLPLPTEARPARKEHRSQAASAAVSRAAAEVDRSVSLSLDELKDKLFRLELRRQAGTISEEEYARERGRTEKVLRDLVKG